MYGWLSSVNANSNLLRQNKNRGGLAATQVHSEKWLAVNLGTNLHVGQSDHETIFTTDYMEILALVASIRMIHEISKYTYFPGLCDHEKARLLASNSDRKQQRPHCNTEEDHIAYTCSLLALTYWLCSMSLLSNIHYYTLLHCYA